MPAHNPYAGLIKYWCNFNMFVRILAFMQRHLLKGVPALLGLSMLAAFSAGGAAAASDTPCSNVKLVLDNPLPGVQVPPGPYVVTGQAMDERASDGTGISSVQMFLGSREAGGAQLGTASWTDTKNGTFNATLGMPSGPLGPSQLQVIATSSVDNKAYEIWVPFTLAFPAFPANTGGSATSLGPLCSSAVQPVVASGPQLKISNPQAGASAVAGPWFVSGTAWDPSASSGSGIDQVQVFLDNRDLGGTWLADATLSGNGANGWQANISLPTNNTGTHALWVYARSSVTGKEMAASVPIVTSAP
jgi:hypothetical protein